MIQHSSSKAFTFAYREDLHTLPAEAMTQEINLHTMFAEDKRNGYIYYALPKVGIVRISPDMREQKIIEIPDHLQSVNFHSCKLADIDGNTRLILTANDNEMVVVFDLNGELDFTIQRPVFEEYSKSVNSGNSSCSSATCSKKCSKQGRVKYQPTDTVLVGDKLYIADGYAENYISVYDVKMQNWSFIFGGNTENPYQSGKFRTAHSISLTSDNQHLIIADRWNSRLQTHGFNGSYVESHYLPYNAWLCSIDFVEWNGRALAVIPCLYDTDEEKKHSAPIYIVDGETFEVISTIRPKEELGIDSAQRIHNAIWHIYDDRLFLICHSWNPGKYFVLEQMID